LKVHAAGRGHVLLGREGGRDGDSIEVVNKPIYFFLHGCGKFWLVLWWHRKCSQFGSIVLVSLHGSGEVVMT
jgi:hypothetical protein